MSMLRCSGVVKEIIVRNGISADGRPWEMRFARILVADLDFTEVGLGDDFGPPDVGSAVDWIVDTAPGGKFVRISRKHAWPGVDFAALKPVAKAA